MLDYAVSFRGYRLYEWSAQELDQPGLLELVRDGTDHRVVEQLAEALLVVDVALHVEVGSDDVRQRAAVEEHAGYAEPRSPSTVAERAQPAESEDGAPTARAQLRLGSATNMKKPPARSPPGELSVLEG